MKELRDPSPSKGSVSYRAPAVQRGEGDNAGTPENAHNHDNPETDPGHGDQAEEVLNALDDAELAEIAALASDDDPDAEGELDDEPPPVEIGKSDRKARLRTLRERWGISEQTAVEALNRMADAVPCPEHKAVVRATQRVQRTKTDVRWSTPNNTRALLEVLRLRPWRERLRWDDFGRGVEVRVPTTEEGRRVLGPWMPVDGAGLTLLHAELDRWSRWGREAVRHGVETVARETTIHPVRDWLRSLRWDGRPRVATWLDRHYGATAGGMPVELARAVGQCWLVSAVARVFKPGEQVDTVLVLAGPQGWRKTQSLKALAGRDPDPVDGRTNANEWFGAGFLDFTSKDGEQNLDGKWIWEIAELAKVRGKDLDRLKHYITNQTPSYRRSFSAWSRTEPRQSVFAATVNKQPGEGYLPEDLTGNRRWWPVAVTRRVDLDALRREREQLWAEAVVLYQAGTKWYLSEELEPVLEAWQRDSGAEEEHPWAEAVQNWLRSHPGREVVTTNEVGELALKLDAEQLERSGTQRGIAAALKACGAVFTRRADGDGKRGRKWTNPYYRPDSSTIPTAPASTPPAALPLTAAAPAEASRRHAAPGPASMPYIDPDDPGPDEADY